MTRERTELLLVALETRREDFGELQEEWQALLPQGALDTLFLTPLWHQAWCSIYQEHLGGELLLVAARDQGRLVGIAPLVQRGETLSFVGDTDLWDYHDCVVLRDWEQEFAHALLAYLGDQQWRELVLPSLRQDSPTLPALSTAAQERGYGVQIEPEDVAPGLTLPTSWDDYLMGLSRKDRHELRRKLRRLERAGDHHWSVVEGQAALDGALDEFFALMRESREEKSIFLTPERESFFRSVAQATAQAGLLRLFFLELEGQRVASALCFDYGDTRLLYNSGFDLRYSSLSVGLLLKALCLRDAIQEGIRYFDFLRGDEAYKYDLGAHDVALYRMVVRRS